MLWNDNPRYSPSHWETIVHGIEAFPDYISYYHDIIYDDVFKVNVLTVLPTLDMYDLIICCDVLEHLTLEDGNRLLDLMKQHGKHSLVSVPIKVSPQNDDFNNPYEKHRTQWAKWYLEQYGAVKRQGKSLVLEIIGSSD